MTAGATVQSSGFGSEFDPKPGMMLNIIDPEGQYRYPCSIQRVIDSRTVIAVLIETSQWWLTFNGRLALLLQQDEHDLDQGRFSRFSEEPQDYIVPVTFKAPFLEAVIPWIVENTYERWSCAGKEFSFQSLKDATFFKLRFVG